MKIFTIIFCALSALQLGQSAMPLPFTRELYLSTPMMSGNDVFIAQSLLLRDDAVDKSLVVDGVYGANSDTATRDFQSAHGLESSGKVDEPTANLLLELHSADGYKDSGFTADSMGYLYKVHIPVYNNRSIETTSTLFDAFNNVMLTFVTRAHGHRDDGSSADWPDFGDEDYGLNQFTSNGNTVTGLFEIDLNSPEPDPALYGPWPVNRLVRGLEGNALMLTPNIRDGMLVHTGNWTEGSGASTGWNPTMTMPNSAGCLHSHPSSIERIYKALLSLGVKVNDNPFSGKDYPYKPQGVAVVELLPDP